VDGYRVLVYAHVFCSILLAGQALFWFIMLAALRQRFDQRQAVDMLQTVNHARWPHVVVPYALRLPLPWVTWATVGALVATGAALVHYRGGAPAGTLWWLKMALTAAVAVIQIAVTRQPRPALIRLNFGLVLATIVVSGWMIR
jgi:hypothetical protein